MANTKEIIYKLGKFEISKFRKGICFSFGHPFIAFYECGVTGTRKIGRHKIGEIHITWGYDSLYFNTFIGRYCDHYLYVLQFNIFKLINFCFEICDNREWDYYKNKRTYEIYDYYNNTTLTYPVGVKPYFKRRKQKAKWYLNTQFLKVYNLDILNNPWGLTIDWAFLPLLIYSKFSFGVDKLQWFDFDFTLEKNKTTGLTFKFRLNLFSRFIEFEIGENTVIREPNTYLIEDFLMLVDFGADPYKENDCRLGNIVKYAIEKKSLALLYVIFVHKALDPAKFDNEETLLEAAYKWNYNKEVFEYLTKFINFIPNWELVEDFKPDLAEGLYEKLLEFKDNPIPEVREEKKEYSLRHPKLLSFQVNGSLKDFLFNIFTYWDRVFHFNIRNIDREEFESNFQLVLSRNFWIRNYFLTKICGKWFDFEISSDNVFLLRVYIDLFGAFSEFNIGTRSEDVWYNFNKQRVMTYQECVLEQEFKKEINTSEKNERRRKYKEFYNSKLVKIYNGNYLNRPYGRTVEFNLPFNNYLKFTFNRIPYYNYKNKVAFEFNLMCDKNFAGRNASRRYMRINFVLFKHYFKIVLGEKSLARFSVLHSDKSLAKFKGAKINKLSLDNLFKNEIKPYETWIFKKVVNLGIDLGELNFDDLIYNLAFKPNYHKQTLDYMLQVAKDNNIRLILDDDNKNKTNAEIIDYIKNDKGKDFIIPAINQLINYVKCQVDSINNERLES